MNRDEARKILGEGATEEQVTNLLNNFHTIEKAKNDEINGYKEQLNKFSDYDEIKQKLDEINKANMTEQEKLEEQKREIEKNLRESRITVSRAKAKEILAGECIDEKQIDDLVTDNVEETIARATRWKQTLSSLKDDIAKKTTENLINVDLKPSMSNVNPNEDGKMTMDKFLGMSASEQEKFIAEHPQEFENL